jgi:hypothetical protein
MPSKRRCGLPRNSALQEPLRNNSEALLLFCSGHAGLMHCSQPTGPHAAATHGIVQTCTASAGQWRHPPQAACGRRPGRRGATGSRARTGRASACTRTASCPAGRAPAGPAPAAAPPPAASLGSGPGPPPGRDSPEDLSGNWLKVKYIVARYFTFDQVALQWWTQEAGAGGATSRHHTWTAHLLLCAAGSYP